eukprot:TRINITY_DN93048_c0_g1_i1.p1 TRINITY_DN93048_c0_g1~~TRINITY_DN93048_c0_g1_i1.p1  ORF type:complete len:573 (+),score=109.95 TRINITY_DN93048_c0_g1_i1:83-1801(+)
MGQSAAAHRVDGSWPVMTEKTCRSSGSESSQSVVHGSDGLDRLRELENILHQERERSQQKENEIDQLGSLLAALENTIEQQSRTALMDQQHLGLLEDALTKNKQNEQKTTEAYQRLESCLLPLTEELRGQLQTLTQCLSAEQAARRDAERRLAERDTQLKELGDFVTAAEKRWQSVQKVSTQQGSRIRDLEEKLAASETERNELSAQLSAQEQVAASERERMELSSQLKAKAEHIAELLENKAEAGRKSTKCTESNSTTACPSEEAAALLRQLSSEDEAGDDGGIWRPAGPQLVEASTPEMPPQSFARASTAEASSEREDLKESVGATMEDGHRDATGRKSGGSLGLPARRSSPCLLVGDGLSTGEPQPPSQFSDPASAKSPQLLSAVRRPDPRSPRSPIVVASPPSARATVPAFSGNAGSAIMNAPCRRRSGVEVGQTVWVPPESTRSSATSRGNRIRATTSPSLAARPAPPGHMSPLVAVNSNRTVPLSPICASSTRISQAPPITGSFVHANGVMNGQTVATPVLPWRPHLASSPGYTEILAAHISPAAPGCRRVTESDRAGSSGFSVSG